MMDVGVVGLGQMGGRMAATLVDAGYSVAVHDVAAARVEALADQGALPHATAAEVGAASDVALVSLPEPSTVSDVVAGPEGILRRARRGMVIVDLSTVDPATSQGMATLSAEVGVDYLDAPVLGRPPACGSWTLPVGGRQEALEMARPVLEHLARRVILVGDHGAGNAVKLLNNLMFGAINAITAEVVAACDAAGLDPEVFYQAIEASGAATVSNLFREIVPKMLEDDQSPDFTMDLLAKDNRLGVTLLEDVGSPAILSRAVMIVNQLGQLRGLGEADTSAVVRAYRSIATQT